MSGMWKLQIHSTAYTLMINAFAFHLLQVRHVCCPIFIPILILVIHDITKILFVYSENCGLPTATFIAPHLARKLSNSLIKLEVACSLRISTLPQFDHQAECPIQKLYFPIYESYRSYPNNRNITHPCWTIHWCPGYQEACRCTPKTC